MQIASSLMEEAPRATGADWEAPGQPLVQNITCPGNCPTPPRLTCPLEVIPRAGFKLMLLALLSLSLKACHPQNPPLHLTLSPHPQTQRKQPLVRETRPCCLHILLQSLFLCCPGSLHLSPPWSLFLTCLLVDAEGEPWGGCWISTWSRGRALEPPGVEPRPASRGKALCHLLVHVEPSLPDLPEPPARPRESQPWLAE